MTKITPTTPYQPQNMKSKTETTQQVAAGVGGAAGISTAATRMAGKRGLSLQSMMGSLTNTARTVSQNTEVATSLWAKFKLNTRLYTADILRRINNLENTKVIGGIMKSPIVKKSAGLFGGALAFFVLVTGVNKAVKTGTQAASDLKFKFDEFRNAA